MGEWKEFKITDFAKVCNHKRVPLSKKERSERTGQYPYYGASGVIDYVDDYIFDGEYVLISEDGENLKSRKTPIAFKAKGKFWVNNHAHILKGKDEHYNDLLIYYFKNLDLNPFITGAVQPKLNKGNLLSIPIFLPIDKVEQEKITSVLSSLDEKIDLLHRQNATLEALAETLFRQWFQPSQELRLAGSLNYDSDDSFDDHDLNNQKNHAHQKNQSSDDVGEDWEEVTLFEAIDLVGGGTPKTSIPEYWDGEINWLSGGDIAANHKDFVISTEKSITQKGLENSSAKLMPRFSTMISARGTVGKYCLLSDQMAFSQSNYGIKPKFDDCYFFTYLLIAHSVEELQSAAYGSVFDTITTKTFKEHTVQLPGEESIIVFENKVRPYFLKMLNNRVQIQTLEKQRDTLLPKLMSGEVELNE